jgi:hypothetical protein
VITFADLAVDTIKVDVPDSTYRFDNQTSAEFDNGGNITMTTWNGTRTYNLQGVPTDNDND